VSSGDQILRDFFGPSYAGTDDTCLVKLDGYFTALGIGPNMVMPNDWIEALLENKTPLKDLDEAENMMGALMERYNGVLQQLNGPPQKYRPSSLPKDSSEPVSLERVSAWSEGFCDGMKLDAGWIPMIRDEDAKTFLAPILAYAKSVYKEKLKAFSQQELVDMLDDVNAHLAEIILMIRDRWRKQKTPPSVHAPKIGRNDPCHCGSGKKYKRCCGAN